MHLMDQKAILIMMALLKSFFIVRALKFSQLNMQALKFRPVEYVDLWWEPCLVQSFQNFNIILYTYVYKYI